MNTLTVNDIYVVANAIVKQATGRTDITAYDATSFISVADIALKTAPDVLLGAISQVLSRTIMSNRPYTRKFKNLETDNVTFGNHVRKLSIVDKDFEAEKTYDLVDGQAIDQQIVNKPEIIQMNFYGETVFTRYYTLFKDQMSIAFSNAQELASFVSMVVQNCADIIEQTHENLSRGVVANAIAATVALNNSNQVIKLITEYNNLTGLSLTPATIYQPANFKPFIEFCYSVMATISEKMTERSLVFHNNITNKAVARHTPKQDQRAWIYTPSKYQMEAMALSDVFNDKYLKLIPSEGVNFWQSIETPDSINMTCGFTDASGSPDSDTVEQSGIFGILSDRELMGTTVVNQWSATAPFNARGGYQNTFFHYTDKYYYDNSENAAVFLFE